MLRIISGGVCKKIGKTLITATAVIITLFTVGCGAESNAPDVSGIKIDLRTQRLDYDLAAIDTNNIAAGLAGVKQKYPGFLDFYLDTLMGFGIQGHYVNDSPGVGIGLRSYLTHKDYREVFDTVKKHYPDTKDIDAGLTKGFQYMKHYFPSYNTPRVIYLITWLNNWAAFTYDSTLGIGLDMFLGAQYPIYSLVGVPSYMNAQMTEDYIPVAAFRAIYQDIVPFNMDNRNLLNMMIQRGKETYFTSQVLPFVPEYTRLGYTEEQLKWCNDNETLVYNFFVQGDMLYSEDWQKILRYIKEAPTSVGLQGSPGNIGTWLGYRIVKAYMEQHPKTTLQQLMQQDIKEQQFLAASKYKPKK
jgi:hypothetical protein